MPRPDPNTKAAQRKRRAAGAILLSSIFAFRSQAMSLLEAYGAETLTSQAWATAYVDVLITLHTQASFAGRSVAATFTGEAALTASSLDDAYGVARAAEQAREFVPGFRRDLEQGKYRDVEGHFDPDLASARVDLYSNGAHGTANQVLVGSLPHGESEGFIRWMLEPGAEEVHCQECPMWAAGGPYTPDSLPAVPGDGKSSCKTNCLCHLEVYGIPVPMLSRPGRNP